MSAVEVVSLSSDSDEDVIIEAEVSEIVVDKVIDRRQTYGRRGPLIRNRRHQRNNETNDCNNCQNSGQLKNEMITPTKIKSSPKSSDNTPQNRSSNPSESQNLSQKTFSTESNVETNPKSLDNTPQNRSSNASESQILSQKTISTESNVETNPILKDITGVEDLQKTVRRMDFSSESMENTLLETPVYPVIKPTAKVCPLSETLSKSETQMDCSVNETQMNFPVNETQMNCPLNETSERPVNDSSNASVDVLTNGLTDELYKCTFVGCDKTFTNATSHYLHERKHRKVIRNSGYHLFFCAFCNFSTGFQTDLIYHNSEHLGLYLCRFADCLFKALSPELLNKHNIECHQQ